MGMVELALIGKLKKTKADKSTTYTKTEVDNLLSNLSGISGITYYASSSAPTSVSAGSIWFNQDTGVVYQLQKDISNNTAWMEIGGASSAVNIPTLSESSLITVTNASTLTYNFVYEPSFIQVFVNRLKLRKSEFTATNGTSITLGIELEVNDEIEFVTVEGV